MAVTIEDIKKLRAMTGAGMKDCKKALAGVPTAPHPTVAYS